MPYAPITIFACILLLVRMVMLGEVFCFFNVFGGSSKSIWFACILSTCTALKLLILYGHSALINSQYSPLFFVRIFILAYHCFQNAMYLPCLPSVPMREMASPFFAFRNARSSCGMVMPELAPSSIIFFLNCTLFSIVILLIIILN